MESDDENELNSQTAYNRAMVEYSARCGCFHCGGIFAGNEVAQWLQEDDGEDTALCPYCGVDAVIVGNEQYPVCMMVLSKLYMHWFARNIGNVLRLPLICPHVAVTGIICARAFLF